MGYYFESVQTERGRLNGDAVLFKAKEFYCRRKRKATKLEDQNFGDTKSVPYDACRLKTYRLCRVMHAPQVLTAVRRLRIRNTLNGITGLTGHNTLKRHLYLMGLSDCPLCRRCRVEAETSVYIFCKSEALASFSLTHLGSFCLDQVTCYPLKFILWPVKVPIKRVYKTSTSYFLIFKHRLKWHSNSINNCQMQGENIFLSLKMLFSNNSNNFKPIVTCHFTKSFLFS
jgi:hypothetical protein